ncbi:unnamed protein product [Mytilus coruscus]|uniref:Farnesoic acid O-methyl transferase domain-containing protein n=1 Tax=Mytilus coruscus TaxID=42192 RepID=A0A6J8EAH7_MYTCO|nr:unnamed protein product [Mytilus coruscus]
MRFAVIFLVGCFSICLGNILNEIWIKTEDSEEVDASSTWNVYEYCTKLSDYELFPSEVQELRFSVKACKDVFIHLSTAANLESPNFYEIVIGGNIGNNVIIRRKVGTGASYVKETPGIISCTDFKKFVLTWSGDGHIQLKDSSDKSVIDWTDLSPFNITGIGIRTGWGSTGTWRIEFKGQFNGYFYGKSNLYGNMTLLRTTTVINSVFCSTLCFSSGTCLGFNFNKNIKECQLIAVGQVMTTYYQPDWELYSKYLNGRSAYQDDSDSELSEYYDLPLDDTIKEVVPNTSSTPELVTDTRELNDSFDLTNVKTVVHPKDINSPSLTVTSEYKFSMEIITLKTEIQQNTRNIDNLVQAVNDLVTKSDNSACNRTNLETSLDIMNKVEETQHNISDLHQSTNEMPGLIRDNRQKLDNIYETIEKGYELSKEVQETVNDLCNKNFMYACSVTNRYSFLQDYSDENQSDPTHVNDYPDETVLKRTVQHIHAKRPNCKIVLSLGISKEDSLDLNKKIQECNVLLQHDLLHTPSVCVCDNSALSIRGQNKPGFFNKDKVHLNFQGTKFFVSNLKFSICKVLGIERKVENNFERYDGKNSYNRHDKYSQYGGTDRQHMYNHHRRFEPQQYDNRNYDYYHDYGNYTPFRCY